MRSPSARVAGILVALILPAVACASLDGLASGGSTDAGIALPERDAEAEAEASADASCTADLGSDPRNCGACGHDCLGGACSAGRCEAVELASQPGPIVGGPIVDSTNVYWVTASDADAGPTTTFALMRHSLASPGAGAELVGALTGGYTDSEGLAATSDSILWMRSATYGSGGTVVTSPGSVFAMPKAGGAARKLVGGDIYALTPQVHGGHVYWVNNGLTYGPMRCALGGCTTPEILAPNRTAGANGLAVDATGFYWTESSNAGDGELLSCPLGGDCSFPTRLAGSSSYPAHVSESGGFVYLTSYGSAVPDSPSANGLVQRVSKDGATTTTISSTPKSLPQSPKVDGDFVYWRDSDLGTVLRAPVTGGVTTVLASNQSKAGGLAVDAQAVYWLTSTSVMRLAK